MAGLEATGVLTLKARKLLAEVEERELRLAVRHGKLIEVEKVRGEWTRRVGTARLGSGPRWGGSWGSFAG